MFTALLIACFVNSNRSCRQSLASGQSRLYLHQDSLALENRSASPRRRKAYSMAEARRKRAASAAQL